MVGQLASNAHDRLENHIKALDEDITKIKERVELVKSVGLPNSCDLKSQVEKTFKDLNDFKCSTSTLIEEIKPSLNIFNTSNDFNAVNLNTNITSSNLNLYNQAHYNAAITLGQNPSVKYDGNPLDFVLLFKSNFESVIKNDGVRLFAILSRQLIGDAVDVIKACTFINDDSPYEEVKWRPENRFGREL